MNILLLGKPGSGKGSVTQRLIDQGFLQLSTGDLLRNEVDSGSDLGVEIAALEPGKFASDEMIFTLVNKFLEKNAGKSIIFDGFPRNVSQTETCLNTGIVFDKVVSLEVSDEKIKERIVNRRVHQPSGRIYNIITMPPLVDGIDDITGEPLTHRKDDKLEVLDKRLLNFRELTQPIVGLLENKGYIIHTINGEIPLEEQVDKVKELIGLRKSTKLKMK